MKAVRIGGRVWSHKSVLALLEAAAPGAPPDDVIREQARALVAKALALRWTGPPYDPITLAGLRGIAVEPLQEDAKADARIFCKADGSLVIQYDSRKPKSRINFSICHEIVHTFFPDCFETVHLRHDRRDGGYELECLCDLGAAELLMPHECFQRDMASAKISLELVRQLNRRYAASFEAVLIRLAQLTDQPCAIVFLSEKLKPVQERAAKNMEFDMGLAPIPPKLRVDYVKPGPLFSVFIPGDKSVPDGSAAYRCLENHDIVEATEQWDVPGFGCWRVQAVELPSFEPNARRVAALVFAGG